MESREMIPVVVSGATGRMGRETVRTVLGQVDMELVGALGHARHLGEDIGELVAGDSCGVHVTADLDEALERAAGGVMVDFSTGTAVKERVLRAIQHDVACVIGTTGIPAADEDEIDNVARAHKHPVLVAPNFALGAVLMMKFARGVMKSRHVDHCRRPQAADGIHRNGKVISKYWRAELAEHPLGMIPGQIRLRNRSRRSRV